MAKRASILLFTGLLAVGCRPKPPAPATPAEIQVLVADSNNLALEMYKDMARGPGNLVFTPLGVVGPGALLAWGARGSSGEGPHFNLAPDRIPTVLEALRVKILQPANPGGFSIPGVKEEAPCLNFGMSLWADKANPIPWASRRILPVLMKTEAQSVDFQRDGLAAMKQIQHWISAQTGGMEVQANLETPQPGGLMVIGSTRFGACWTYPFIPNKTRTEPFHCIGGQDAPVKMMHHHEVWPYAQDGDCEATCLPYAGTALQMVILLPGVGRLSALERGFDLKRLNRILAQLERHEPGQVKVQLSLPRFNIAQEVNLDGALGKRGLRPVLSGEAALPRLQQQATHLPISVKQVTNFEIDEKGTQAATLTIAVSLGEEETKPFRVDRPFMFIIRDQGTGAILYVGRFTGPNVNFGKSLP